VVNANDRLDYFGNTVNQAARIEGQSKGGDVVITDSVARDPEVAGLLPSSGMVVSKFETQLKGLTGNFMLTRIEVAPVAAKAANG
jgi:class 3 adenylate cyclase